LNVWVSIAVGLAGVIGFAWSRLRLGPGPAEADTEPDPEAAER
jgi:hypothetical protein